MQRGRGSPGNPAQPPFGQFSVRAKWTLKEAVELEPNCRSPTQKRLGAGGDHSEAARKVRRGQDQAPAPCQPHATVRHLPHTEGVEGGRETFRPVTAAR